VHRAVRVLPNTFEAVPRACAAECVCGCEGGADFWRGNFTLLGVEQEVFDHLDVHLAFKVALMAVLRERANSFDVSLDYLSLPDIGRIDTYLVGEKEFVIDVTIETLLCDNQFLLESLPQLAVTDLNDPTRGLLAKLREFYPNPVAGKLSIFDSTSAGATFLSLDEDTSRLLPRACTLPPAATLPTVQPTAAAAVEVKSGKGKLAASIVIPLLFLISIAVVAYFRIKKKREDLIDECLEEMKQEVAANPELYGIYAAGANGEIYGVVPDSEGGGSRALLELDEDDDDMYLNEDAAPFVARTSQQQGDADMYVNEDAGPPMLPTKGREAIQMVPIAARSKAGRNTASGAGAGPGYLEVGEDEGGVDIYGPNTKLGGEPTESSTDDANADPNSAFLHAELDRAQAEALLSAAGDADGDGRWLVRCKGSNNYVVSLSFCGLCEHHTLSQQQPSGTWVINKQPLSNPHLAKLSDVVAHLGTDKEEMTVALGRPVPPVRERSHTARGRSQTAYRDDEGTGGVGGVDIYQNSEMEEGTGGVGGVDIYQNSEMELPSLSPNAIKGRAGQTTQRPLTGFFVGVSSFCLFKKRVWRNTRKLLP
jgi:hypothetical protein